MISELVNSTDDLRIYGLNYCTHLEAGSLKCRTTVISPYINVMNLDQW